MVQLLSLREPGWLTPDVETFIWRQLRHAFRVDRVELASNADEFESKLANCEGQRVFLQPEATHAGIPLSDFTHPESAVYCFGNASDNVMRFVNEAADQLVTVYTPSHADVFAVNAASITLYDRMVKRVS